MTDIAETIAPDTPPAGLLPVDIDAIVRRCAIVAINEQLQLPSKSTGLYAAAMGAGYHAVAEIMRVPSSDAARDDLARAVMTAARAEVDAYLHEPDDDDIDCCGATADQNLTRRR